MHIIYLGATITASTSSTVPTDEVEGAAAFTLNRQLWDEGPDILALQQWLNANGFQLAAAGAGSPGNETDIFGPHTYQAPVRFQAAHSLPATGFLGPITRAALTNASTSPSD